MNLKAFVLGYQPASPNMAVLVYFKSDDGTISAPADLTLMPPYSSLESDITTSVATTINNFCSANSLPVPAIIWCLETPAQVAADIAAAIAGAISSAPSSYQTIVSQSGTAAPVVSGSLSPVSTYPAGTTFTWARTGAGVYTLTASTAVFNTSGKTGIFIAPLQNLNAQARGVVTSTTVITFTTAVGSVAVLGLLGLTATNTDALLSSTMIYVQTYA